MQNHQIQSFLAYMWALGIVPTSESVSADSDLLANTPSEPKIFDAQAIQNEVELQAALSDPDITEITLANDIITAENLVVNRNDRIELNLNGFKIASLSENARVLDIQAGGLSLLGLGSIVATGTGASAVRIKGAMTADNINYSYLMVAADVTLYAPNYYGLFITPNFNAAYGVTVDLYGSVIAHDGICIHGNIQGRGDNVPHINILEGAKIIADEFGGIAINALGNGIWEIGAADLAGGTGMEVESGSLTLSHTNLIATGPSDLYSGSGAAIRLEDNFAHHIKLKIHDGSYLSVQGYTFYEYSELEGVSSLHALEIYNGNFSGQSGIFFGVASRNTANFATRIYGGKFSSDVSQYLAPEHHIESNRMRSEYTVVDESEPSRILDKTTQLSHAKTELEELIEFAKRYVQPSYAGNELGELQATVNKVIGAIKRAIKSAEKVLKTSDLTLAKVKNATRRLDDHLGEIQSIENAMRSEISEAIRLSKEQQLRYTPDSYLDLSLAAADAEQLLAREQVTLVELQDMLGVIDAAKIMLEEVILDDYDSTEESTDQPEAAIKYHDMLSIPLSVGPVNPNPAADSFDTDSELDSAIDISDDTDDTQEFINHLQAAELLSEPIDLTESTVSLELPVSTESVEPVESIEPIEPYDSLPPAPSIGTEFTELSAPDSGLETESLELPEVPEAEPITLSEPENETMPITDTLDSIQEAYDVPLEPPVPVFIDPELASAKQSLRDLLNAISTLNPGEYTIESYAVLARTASMAGNLLTDDSSHTTPAVLLSAFNSVNLSYKKLVKKSEHPANAALETAELNLRTMLDAVQSLSVSDYELSFAEQFGELQVAIAKAKAILARSTPDLQEIMNIMDEIQLATSGLKGASPQASENTVSSVSATSEVLDSVEPELPESSPVVSEPVEELTPELPLVALDWNDFTTALKDIRSLNAADYTITSYQKLLTVLESAKTISTKTDLTQSEIDEVVFELNLAMLALERPEIPRLSSVQEFSSAQSQQSTNDNQIMTTSPTPSSVDSKKVATPPISQFDESITPSLLMSMMAGAYAGLATYRRSRFEAKKRKSLRSSSN